MKKNIAIISEGISQSSRTIAQNVAQLFQEVGYHTELVYIGTSVWTTTNPTETIDKNDFSIYRNGYKICFDGAYIYSEEEKTKGWIQGYLSLLGIPYISSTPLATMLCANKFFCKNHLQSFGILTPKAIKINPNQNWDAEDIVQILGLPCMVKPNIGTDSYMAEKVHTIEALESAIRTIISHNKEPIVEEFIEGRDITCGVIEQNGKILATPLTEIQVPKGTFYSYEVKLQRRNTKQTPAPLPTLLTESCQDISKRIFQLLECEDYVRIDFRLNGNAFYFLEVNITPGISTRGNFPLQLKAMRISISELLKERMEANIQKQVKPQPLINLDKPVLLSNIP